MTFINFKTLFLVLFLGVASCATTTTPSSIGTVKSLDLPRELAMRVRSTTASRKLGLIPRHLDVDQCIDELVALALANPALADALTNYEDEYDAAQEACGEAATCTVNEDTFPSTPLYQAACQDAGGEIWESDYIVQCTITASDGTSETISYVFLNEDSCVPTDSQACEPGEIVAAIEKETNETIDFLEDLVAAGSNDTLQCDFGMTITNPSNVVEAQSGNLEVPDSGTATMMKHMVLSLVIGTVVMVSVFFI